MTSAVVFQVGKPRRVALRIRCRDAGSLRTLAIAAVWTNVSITLGNPETRICAEPDKNNHDLPCDIELPDHESEMPTPAELLCAWLALELAKAGQLTRAEMLVWQSRLKTPISLHLPDDLRLDDGVFAVAPGKLRRGPARSVSPRHPSASVWLRQRASPVLPASAPRRNPCQTRAPGVRADCRRSPDSQRSP